MHPVERTEHDPAFPITVDEDFYWAVVGACGGPFADSYLWGGRLTETRFLPRTVTGWEKLSDSMAFMDLLAKRRISLTKPEPYAGPAAWKILGFPDPGDPKPRRRGA